MRLYRLRTMTIDYATMNKLHQLVWICDTFREPAHDIAVTFTLDVGYIIAQADIATLEYAVHLGNLTDNLHIEVKDSAIVLAKLLDNLWRNETSSNQFLHCTFCYPLGILDIALMTWKLLDEFTWAFFPAEMLKHRKLAQIIHHHCAKYKEKYYLCARQDHILLS